MEKLHDPAAERAILAGIFQYGYDGYLEVSDLVDQNAFADYNGVVYNCLEKVLENDQEIDDAAFLSMCNTLNIEDIFDNQEKKDYLNAFKEFPVKLENLRHYASKIRKLQLARDINLELRLAQEEILKITGMETVDEIISKAEKPIFELSTGVDSGNTPYLMGADIHEHVEELKANEGLPVGISTGFERLDGAIGGGFRRKTVTLFPARMGVGKSMLADHFGLHSSKTLNIPTLMLDTEMSVEDHQNRILANLTNLDINDIESGKFGEDSLKNASKILEKIPFYYISVAGKPFEEILSICRRWLLKEVGFDENGRLNDCLIVYDYFKLMDVSILKYMPEHQALGFQISSMHDFCVKYDCPVASFVQTNRDGIDTETTAVIAQSDRLAWIATTIVLFKGKTAEEIAEQPDLGNRKMVTLKTRHGAGLMPTDYINMSLEGSHAKLTELLTRFEAIERESS